MSFNLFFLTVGNRRPVSFNLGLLHCKSHCGEGTDLLFGDISHDNFARGSSKGKDGSIELSGRLAFSSSRITILHLTQTLLGEDDELGLVFLQTGDIEREGLSTFVGTTVVHSDTNSLRVSGSQTSTLQLLERESLSKTNLGGVTLCGAVYCGAEQLERSGSDFRGLGGTSETTALFLGRLIQGETDLKGATRRLTVLLVTMDIGDDVIVLHHL
mmetsp:Transcript_17785/g.32128  ORF Transcript_17785/g.32128 Transcript_17785/m.32128 type:complete len:214 (-) Transcript_17785:59-700(-)